MTHFICQTILDSTWSCLWQEHSWQINFIPHSNSIRLEVTASSSALRILRRARQSGKHKYNWLVMSVTDKRMGNGDIYGTYLSSLTDVCYPRRYKVNSSHLMLTPTLQAQLAQTVLMVQGLPGSVKLYFQTVFLFLLIHNLSQWAHKNNVQEQSSFVICQALSLLTLPRLFSHPITEPRRWELNTLELSLQSSPAQAPRSFME